MSVAIRHELFHAEKHIVNHDIIHCTAEGVKGNHLYSGRALGITVPGDIIQLRSELKENWDSITAHYARVGLEHTSDVIWNVNMHHLGQFAGHSPSVFYFGPEQYINWGDHEWLSTTEYINSKNNFIEVAKETGVAIPKTLAFDSVTNIDDNVLSFIEFPCYLKAAVSVSGVGIYRCEDKQELLFAISRFHPGTPVQIQEEVVSKTFLNMQYKVENGYAVRLACTEQILEGFVHQGNRYPACCEPWGVVEPMAQWLVERNIKGIFAFDVAVVETAEGTKYKAIECNPRFNGASYPTLIANKLGIKQWVSKTFTTSYRKLEDIFIEHIEFKKHIGRGVILVNWGTVSEGKLMFIIAGNDMEKNYYEEELKRCL